MTGRRIGVDELRKMEWRDCFTGLPAKTVWLDGDYEIVDGGGIIYAGPSFCDKLPIPEGY